MYFCCMLSLIKLSSSVLTLTFAEVSNKVKRQRVNRITLVCLHNQTKESTWCVYRQFRYRQFSMKCLCSFMAILTRLIKFVVRVTFSNEPFVPQFKRYYGNIYSLKLSSSCGKNRTKSNVIRKIKITSSKTLLQSYWFLTALLHSIDQLDRW